MKRREALEYIEKYLNEHSIYQIHSNDILTLAEEIGMQPPLNEENYHFMDNYDRDFVNKAKWYFCWEDEDESN